MSITWQGRPISKKSSQRIIMRNGRRIIIYSKAYDDLRKRVLPGLRELRDSLEKLGITLGTKDSELHVRAVAHAGKGTEPDLSGVLETIGDILQDGGVIENDRWVKSWDGSRVYTHDKDHPRVELDITELGHGWE